MNKLIVGFLLAMAPLFGMASGGAHLTMRILISGIRRLCNGGAKYFVNYCLSCHQPNFSVTTELPRTWG